MSDKNRLRFLFNESIHQIGSKLNKFIEELEIIISSKQKLKSPIITTENQKISIIYSEPVREFGKLNKFR